ncbi:MAG: thioredoxin domain-containing protein [Nanoarchaeota archaeon]|nr:thioredoxin domain-containing protein [Nanoarchaeota archaeon]MBU1623238.1 thioredoxin domain-containing protein [Nanoarchaeota archaeon]MBU1974667.1 thioredoxin domain-containing protein [Nanoarchaeota archaeon]
MEQKQIDEIEGSYKGEEFIDEEDLLNHGIELDEVKIEPAKAKRGRPKKSSKTVDMKAEEPKEEMTDNFDEVKVVPITEEPKPDPAKEPTPGPAYNPWDDEEEKTSSGSSTWKAISGILVILLIISIFTQGFNFADGAGVTGAATAELSLSEAEEQALTYVNTNLLQPPFTAELESSEDVGSMYKITLSVAGQEIDSYLTKDGELFFPQGFDTSESLDDLTAPTTETTRLDVSTDDDAVKGNPDATVTIVEFSEFQCPFCAKFFQETYPLIIKNYVDTGKVNYVFRDFPLDFHQNAQKAAEAAECAGEQDKYYEMHDYLFTNQDYLEVENLKGYAKDLGLDTTEFNDCLDSGEMEDEVKADLAEGKTYGVSGTPAFFINGKMISGAQPYSVFTTEIEAALAEDNSESVVEGNLEEAQEEVTEELEEPEVVIPSGKTQEFTVNAKRWLFSPNEFTVNKGDTVKLTITASDLAFTFAVPDLGVSEEVSGTTIVEFTASQAGSFEFKCASCEAWRGMTGTLVVE